MRVRPFARCIVLVLLATVLVAALPGVEAQGRTPLTLDFFMSNEPDANATGLGALQTFRLLPGTSGTAATVDSGCATPGGRPGGQVVAGWISDPVFDSGATVLSASEIVLSIGSGEAIDPTGTGMVPGPNQAVTFGEVVFTLRLTGGPDASHDIATSEFTVPGPAGGATPNPTGAQMPASVNFTFAPSGVGAHPAQLPIVALLSIACQQTASFTVTSGSFTLGYLYGDPNDPDTDGDGIPDPDDDDADGDGFPNDNETTIGTDPLSAQSNPSVDADGDGFTAEQEFDARTSDTDPDDFPGAGGFPWLLIILIVLIVLLLAGGAVGALAVVGRKVKISVSHDGFQAIDKGQVAEYEVTVLATGKKEEMIPVQLSLKGVPEDWSAQLEPDHLTLYTGEAAEAQTATLRLVPPPDEQYESEAQVTITATPTDEDGKTSAMKPGSSVKTKTIVNIGVTPPEGEKKAKKPKKAADETPAEEPGAMTEAAAEEKPKRRFGLGRRKKDDEPEAPEGAPEAADAAAMAAPAAAPAPTPGKPSIAMGQMVHDPADFSAGDEVTTKVSVRNKGDSPVAGLKLSLYVNDQRADQQTVDLSPGESKEVSFSWTAQPDENRVRIKGGLSGA